MADASLWGLWTIAVVATAVPRVLGVLAAGRVDPDSRAFAWITAVAYAITMGLAVRLLLLPTGPLTETPFLDRFLTAAVALGVFFATRQNFLVGFGAGVVLFWAIEFWRFG
jgi:hypothetical protein